MSLSTHGPDMFNDHQYMANTTERDSQWIKLQPMIHSRQENAVHNCCKVFGMHACRDMSWPCTLQDAQVPSAYPVGTSPALLSRATV